MREYYKRMFAAFWKDFAKSTAEQVVGALLAVAILVLQIHYEVTKEAEIKGSEWAIAWPYIMLVAAFFLIHLLRVPWKLDQKLQEQIGTLTEFKRSVEDSVIHLSLARDEVKMVPFGAPHPRTGAFIPTASAECIYLIFANHKKLGMPGKIARNVLARVRYTELETGKSFEQDGRWANNDQPAMLDVGQSKKSIVRTDFDVGDEHPLDIAAKFQDGCYAVNNEGVRRTDNVLRGDVAIAVHLIAEHVDQTFKFELRNVRSAVMMKMVLV